ncbi:hypothetical protein BS47DRAFT_1374369 [Hydnum rufescens UP504]|uniref:Sof1-like protein domain-containing protein n=1 Tax=Hydnum rufescens UP504 TaxID=1448309 RepID=A0A9P6AFC9_9AGAM|nr:hypothetical protein BS47DRAFT_1374369 [Hydnum rufescens UP504]
MPNRRRVELVYNFHTYIKRRSVGKRSQEAPHISLQPGWHGRAHIVNDEKAMATKISVLHYRPSDHLPSRSRDLTPVARNLDPLMHPFANTRDLEGHADGVNVVMRKAYSLAVVALPGRSEIILHALPQRKYPLRLPAAHKRSVTGRCFADSGRLLSCGVDPTVKMWDEIAFGFPRQKHTQVQKLSLVVKVILSSTRHTISAIDHHRTNALFVTASHGVHIWDETKTMTALKFDLPETSVLASTGSDRTFTLDTHANALAWSPTLCTSILLASEDHNLYIIRYKGRVAVTIRIWNEVDGRGNRAYQTKRMQREHRVKLREEWTYNPEVSKIERYVDLGPCGWIHLVHFTRRHLPKWIYNAAKLKQTMLDAQRVKEERRQKHSRAGETKPKAEWRKVVGAEQS